MTAPSLLAIALDVAVLLGDPWRVAPSSATLVGEHVVHPDGYDITLWLDGDRVEILGKRLPGTAGDEHHTTAQRTAAHVLAAVKRLLPGYVADFDRGRDQLASRVRNMEARLATAEQLRPLVPGASITPDHLYLRWSEDQLGHGRVTVGDDGTVRLEVTGLPVETCARMLDAMVGAVR